MYLCNIVIVEVFITSGIEVLRITKAPPQFGGDSLVVYLNDLCTDIISFRKKSSISQQTDAAKTASTGHTCHVGKFHIIMDLYQSIKSHLRKHRGVNGSLDDSSIDRQNRKYDTGQEDQCQLIDIFDPHKHHQCHEAQHNSTVHSHVVEQCCFCLWALQALNLKDGCLGNNINLKEANQWRKRGLERVRRIR